MENKERDLLIRLEEKITGMCQSLDTLRETIANDYATKDYVTARIAECMTRHPQAVNGSGISSFFNSKAGIAIIIVTAFLAVLGIAAIIGSNSLTEQDIVNMIAKYLEVK
jgi:hypothetical protein